MPADATDRMAEAIVLHVERYFHVKDIVREPGAKPGQGKQVQLRPGASWLALALEQLLSARSSFSTDRSQVRACERE
jgi:hypothetical protein